MAKTWNLFVLGFLGKWGLAIGGKYRSTGRPVVQLQNGEGRVDFGAGVDFAWNHTSYDGI